MSHSETNNENKKNKIYIKSLNNGVLADGGWRLPVGNGGHKIVKGLLRRFKF